MRFILICAALLASPVAGAQWSEADTARQIVIAATYYADYKQTSYIFGHPEKFSEMNPLIKADNIGPYFLAAAALAAGVAYVAPDKWRPYVQTVFIGVQTLTIMHNARAGVGGEHSFYIGYTHRF